ncbi:MAG TPA: hypothetical protein VMF09_02295 [Solirubrobacteraceae bacterium]|nr:hypothetical protein [Solirubrobacteraceae bacterium]
MPILAPRPLLAALALCVALCALGGCGKTGPQQTGVAGRAGSPSELAPVAAQGAVSVATRNTTRLGGADVASDAAAVARAVYPGLTAASRPAAAVLLDEHDWPAALAASVLAGAPTGAPILYSEGETLPAVSRETLEAMHPSGVAGLAGAQVIEIGTSATPPGYRTHTVPVGTPADTAAAIERLALTLDGGHAPAAAIVLGENARPALAMPAAGLAAQSGAPILFVSRAGVPAATAAALAGMHGPSIYVIDAAAVGHRALAELRRLGHVAVIPSGSTPAGSSVSRAAVQNAIEVARFTDGTFGWGVKEPGHGLVFANLGRPLDAPAAALLSATGEFAPLLLLASATEVPPALARYLSDIQPGYSNPQFPAVRGAYNHGWLIGGERAISTVSQVEIDSMLEIAPRAQTTEEPLAAQAE